jgi:hypothetical protein
MLTLFAVPKPFRGRIGELQRNGLASWTALGDGVQVVLLGDEEGVAGEAARAGAGHVPDLARTAHGTPRLDDALARVDAVAAHPLRAFVNADVILLDDFLPAVRRVAALGPRFLMIGQTRDLDVPAAPDLGALRAEALSTGRLRGAAAMDYFVFPADLYRDVPPFAIGRACFDNWLVWQARREGPVVDATAAVVAVHQRHGYDHLAGGKDEAYYGEEAARNLELAGGKSRLYTLHDVSHVLRDGRVRRNLGAPLRWRENARKAAWKLGLR